MVRRDALSEYARGSLWVLPTLSVAVALAAGSLLSAISVGVHSPLAFQGTPDDARNLLIREWSSARRAAANPGR